MKLTVSLELKEILKDFFVIAYTMDVVNQKTKEVDELLKNLSDDYLDKYPLSSIVQLPKIKETRDGYKRLGKDPSHTRAACEALLRRFVKGSIYRLGDIIDIGNVLSLLTQRSVCVVDKDKLQGDIFIRKANEETIDAINRGVINISKLPVYTDEIGPFGTPTSDTYRTMVTNETKSILVMIICFSKKEIAEDEKLLIDLYKKYTNAINIQKIEVQYGKF